MLHMNDKSNWLGESEAFLAPVNEILTEDVESPHPMLDEMPEPHRLAGHEISSKVNKLQFYYDQGELTEWSGGEDLAMIYKQFRQDLQEGILEDSYIQDFEEFRQQNEIPEQRVQEFEVVKTGIKAVRDYVDILRYEEPGAVNIDDILVKECIEPSEAEYGGNGYVKGNMSLWIPLHTMCKNSHEYAAPEVEQLEINIEVEEAEGSYTITHTDNGPGIPADIREDIYDFDSDNSSSTGLPVSARIVEWAGGEIEYHEDDGYHRHQIRLPKA